MIPKDRIKKHYDDVRNSLDTALNETSDVKFEGKDENLILETIKKKLSEINTKFKDDIDEFERDSEWEKLSIAFFGETGSGKSTLIDTLRIVFQEETRTAELLNNREKIDEAARDNVEAYKNVGTTFLKLKNSIQKFVHETEINEEQYAKEIDTLKNQNKNLETEYLQFKTGIQQLISHKDAKEKEYIRTVNDLQKLVVKTELSKNRYVEEIDVLKSQNKNLETSCLQLRADERKLISQGDIKEKEYLKAINSLEEKNTTTKNVSVCICVILTIISFLVGLYF